jgi:hypothetical protein
MTDHTLRPILWVSLTLLILLAAPASASDHLPGDGAPEIPAFGYEGGVHTRVFVDFGDLDAMAAYVATYESDRNALAQALTLGGYYRVHRNLKLGAFYRLGLGQRHDDDWIEANSTWIWRNTALRPEHTAIVDVTPRMLLRFLPGEDWVFAFKARYEITAYSESGTFEMHQTALLRPGLTWFWIVDREPVLNVALNYATYLSLDFGRTWWYRHGPYLNVAYHVSPFLIADLAVGTQWIFWSESAQYLAEWPNDPYAEPIYRPWTLELGLVYRPGG